LCKQIGDEKDLKENKKPNAEQKLLLNCNEKCESKLEKKNDVKNNESKVESRLDDANTNRGSWLYFILGFMALLISIIIYFLVNFE